MGIGETIHGYSIFVYGLVLGRVIRPVTRENIMYPAREPSA